MENTASILHAKEILFLIGLILGVGTATGFLARLIKIPDVVLFLVAGMLLGGAGFAVIDVKVDSTLNQLMLIFGSCYILFDGGASVRLNVLKSVWPSLLSMATVGVLISAVVTAVAAQYFLHLPFIFALLLGAVIASTDPATLVPVFRQVKVRAKVAQTVMSESALNDAMGAILTFAVLGIALSGGEFSVGASLMALLQQSLLGILGGALFGYAAALLIAHEKLSFLSEYTPVVTLMAVAGAYLSVDQLHASGFMAVFVFGMVLGNKDLLGFQMATEEANKLEDFISTTSLMMRMFAWWGMNAARSAVSQGMGQPSMAAAVGAGATVGRTGRAALAGLPPSSTSRPASTCLPGSPARPNTSPALNCTGAVVSQSRPAAASDPDICSAREPPTSARSISPRAPAIPSEPASPPRVSASSI